MSSKKTLSRIIMDNRTLRITLIFGVVAGVTFSLLLWAYEAILLTQAHVAYSWLVLTLGVAICTPLFVLAAWLAYVVGRAIISVVIWVLVARLVAEFIIAIPLLIAPRLIFLFEPGLHAWLSPYLYNETFRMWIGITFVILSVFWGILGLMQLTIVEQAAYASTPASRLSPYLIIFLVMMITCSLTSNVINNQLRAPMLNTNASIQFAIDHLNTDVDHTLARQMHMGAIQEISDMLVRPRRLFLGQYDEYYRQVEILIDFQGEWAACTTVIGQVTNCRLLSNP